MATLSEVIDQYIVQRRSSGLASNTVRNDARYLKMFLADIGNIQTRNLRPQHVDLFRERRFAQWGPGTKNLVSTILMTFFKWCQGRGHIPRSMELMPMTKRHVEEMRPRVIIPQDKWGSLLESCKVPYQRITVATGLYLFTRISETQNLRWQDYYEGDKPTIDVFRIKTKTLDTLPVCEEYAEELQRWRFAYAAEVGCQPEPGWFLIPGKTPRTGRATQGIKGFSEFDSPRLIPTKRSRLATVIQSALEANGYYKPLEGGHTLRRSGATALYNQLSSVGHDRAIRICQAMLGHKNILTTERYLRLDLDRKVRDDLLSGQPMFPKRNVAPVIQLSTASGDVNGQANNGDVRV